MGNTLNIDVADPWFGAIASGQKNVLLRLNVDTFTDIRNGVNLKLNNQGLFVKAKANRVLKYASVEDALVQEGLLRTIPGARTLPEAVSIYRNMFSEADERQYGVVCIHLKRKSGPWSTNMKKAAP